MLGGIAATLDMPEAPTAFDVGVQRFTWFMVALVAVMTPVVILVNGLTKGDWWQAVLFGLAVAVVLMGLWLPGSWLGDVVGFVPIPLGYWPFLAVTVVAYGLTVSFVKRWLIECGWIS